MFQIHAKLNGVTKISINGDIGKSLTGDYVTLENVLSQIEGIEGDVEVTISSLGGLGVEGLKMYDALKSIKGNVKTRMIGAVASAGTYPAMAGEPVSMASNARFLIHPCHTSVEGNASKLREVLGELEYFDEIQADFYLDRVSRKGKTLEDIKELMAQEKFIDAETALEWGFVDEIFEPVAIAAKYNKEDLEQLGIPELPQEYYANIKEPEMENNQTNIDAILAKFGLQKIKAEVSVETLTAENESLKSELEKLRTESELEKSNFIQASKEISETTEKEVSEIKAKYEFLQTENESIKAEIEKYKAGEKQIDNSNPNPDGKETPAPIKAKFQPENEELRNLVKNLNTK